MFPARFLLLSCLLLAGCASSRAEPPTDAAFGSAVRHMIQEQIYDRAAAEQPPLDPPSSTDGARAAAALATYRTRPAISTPPISTEATIGVSKQ